MQASKWGKPRRQIPTIEELRDAGYKEERSSKVDKSALKRERFLLASEMVAAQNETRSAAATIKEQWSKGAVGYVPEVKNDRVCRFVFENYNSLSFWHSQHKIHHLNKLLRQFNADCALGAELQVQWDMADSNLRLDKLLMPGQQKRVAVGYNRHEAFSRSQHGGVSLATFDRLSQFVLESGSDQHGLGRWVWMKISSGSLVTIVVVAYLPCKSKASATANKQRRETVYNQQGRYFRGIGDVRCPRVIMVDHLGQQLADWKEQEVRVDAS